MGVLVKKSLNSRYEMSKGMKELFRKMEIEDEDERLVGGWVSLEVVDKQGDIIPVDELERAMLKLMDRGGFIFYGHQNKPVGKVLKWEVREHPDLNVKGVYVIAKIFKDYKLDDEVWKMIKEGKLKGFSVGGRSNKMDYAKVKGNGGKSVRVLKDVELNEISLVSSPANPYALIEEVNYFAKGDIMDVEKVDKRYLEESGRFKEMTCPDDPSKKSRFCGCVRAMMNDGYSLDSAKRICGYIKRYVKKSDDIDDEEVEKEMIDFVKKKQNEFAYLLFGKGYSELSDGCKEMIRDLVEYEFTGDEFAKDYEFNKPEDLRPPKEWWERCVDETGNPRLCGWVYFHHLKPEKPESKKEPDEPHTREARRRKRKWLEETGGEVDKEDKVYIEVEGLRKEVNDMVSDEEFDALKSEVREMKEMLMEIYRKFQNAEDIVPTEEREEEGEVAEEGTVEESKGVVEKEELSSEKKKVSMNVSQNEPQPAVDTGMIEGEVDKLKGRIEKIEKMVEEIAKQMNVNVQKGEFKKFSTPRPDIDGVGEITKDGNGVVDRVRNILSRLGGGN